MPITTITDRAPVLEVAPIGAAGVLAIVSEALRALGERRDAGARPEALAAETAAALAWARAELEGRRGAAAEAARVLVATAGDAIAEEGRR